MPAVVPVPVPGAAWVVPGAAAPPPVPLADSEPSATRTVTRSGDTVGTNAAMSTKTRTKPMSGP